LGRRQDGPGYALSVHLTVTIKGLPEDVARDVMERADRVCPYSNAIRGNVPVTKELVTG
jgi:organic hydroperoxide reductase OsmC/OhrA